MAKGAINVQITGDYSDKDIKRAIKDLESLQGQAGPTVKSFSMMEGGWKQLGTVAAIGAAAVAAGVAMVLKNATEAASTFEQTAGAAQQLFGEAAGNAAIEWSRTTSTSMGLARNSALDALNTFGVFARTAGLAGDEAVNFSQEIVMLAADMSAFKGTTVEDAIQSIGAALRGERDPIEKYGQILTATSVDAEAAALGFEKVNGQFTAQAKILATKKLIEKNNELLGVTGQNAREADTFAGAMSRVNASLEDLQLSLGEGFIQGFADEMERAGDAAKNMKDMEQGAYDIGQTFGSAIPLAIGALVSFIKVVQSVTAESIWAFQKLNYALERSAINTQDFLGTLGDAEAEAARNALDLAYANDEAAYKTVIMGIHVGEAAGQVSNLQGQTAGAVPSVDQYGNAVEGVGDNAVSTEDALKKLKEEVRALQGLMSNRQAQDDFAKSLRDLDETLEGNKRTFKGMSDSALENRDTLRTAFSDAAGVVQGFVEEGRISEAEFGEVFAGTGKKIVDDLVAQGFKKKDIKAFLKSEGLWTDELAAIFSKGNNKEALDESERLGYDLATGISIGVGNGTPQIKTAMSGTVLSAIQAGKKAGEIKSPSQVTRDQIGLPLAQGIAEGIKAGGDEVRKAMQDNFLSWFKDTKESLKSELDDAKRMFEDYRSSVSQSIMGGIDFGSIAPEFDESGQRVGMTFIEALNAQAAQAQAFAVKVKELVALGLSEAALTQVLQAGVSAGTNIANELITGGATTIAETNELVATTQAAADEVGLLAANSFYSAGVKNAQDTYDGFKANFGQGGPARAAIMKVMDNLANSMNRTATITVTTVNRTVNEVIGRYGGERAMGGPVAASTAYLVGERGPELFIPNSAGQIIPNGDLPTASGTFTRGGDGASMGAPINLTVNAGMGTDGAEVGRQVVEALKAYSRRNGPLPLAVA